MSGAPDPWKMPLRVAASSTEQRTCATCVFWDDRDGLGFGLCRVRPPVPDTASQIVPTDDDEDDDPLDADGRVMIAAMLAPGSWHGRWPVTAGDDWCGGYQAR